MVLLFIAFTLLVLIAFGTVSFMIRPTTQQKAIDRRIGTIKASQGALGLVGDDLEKFLKASQSGNPTWLEELIQKYELPQKLQMIILQANSTITIAKLLLTTLGTGLIAAFICSLFVPMLPITIAVALVAGYIPIGVLSMRRKRRIAAFNAALPDCIDMMARSLRAGHSLVASIHNVADQAVEPARTEFGEVFKKQNYGLPLRDALMQLLDRVPSQDLRVLVTGVLVQKDTGGNLAEILDRIVVVIRERLRIQGEIRVHTAQGRMTGWILCLLPIVMLFMINIINPGYSHVLLYDPAGRKFLYIGMVLLASGGLLIRKIVSGIEV